MSNNICTLQLPSIEVWLYAISIHGVCCVFGAVPIAIFFWTLLPKKTTASENNKHENDYFVVITLLTGILAATVVPLWMLYLTDPKTTPWIGPFLASTFGFATFFKSWNVAFQQYPQGSDASLPSWMYWFVMLPEPLYNNNSDDDDNKTKGKKLERRLLSQGRRQVIWTRLCCFGSKIVGLGLVLSLLRLESSSKDHRLHLSHLPLLPDHWIMTVVNGYIHIWLLYLFVSSCTDFSTLTNYATTVSHGGVVAFRQGFDNPLLESRSFKEAWGLRWNLPVQTLLQRTSYVPLRRQGYSRGVAAIGTFVISGLLHEYIFFIHNHVAYQFGKATVFFVWMGMTMMAEEWAWDYLIPISLQQLFINNRHGHIPAVVIAVLLTLTASIPFEWYFFQSWLDAGFVDCIAKMFPHLKCNY